MKQAEDFKTEAGRLEVLLSSLDEDDFGRITAFKGWRVNEILRHLHVWNLAAYFALSDEAAITNFLNDATPFVTKLCLPEFEDSYLNGLSGKALLNSWAEFYRKLAAAYKAADPSQRVAWAGPGMSARSSMTARQMETWAHGQAIYDVFGLERKNTDAIQNIVTLGVKTYGWTFVNRGRAAPEPRPKITLTAPSGDLWTYGDDQEDERIEGEASEFCQVVTQVRNIEDTELVVIGRNAGEWMQFAQCFAGPPVDPPAPGTRKRTPSPA